ncbi:hypothetical protein Tel_07975 [Candidatus Tenderia electrophaga]|jgi:Zn-dependent protease with chaperone function|uniref:Peptidase M48 domain-containing protein n=1 Tax=Candidatus Tenderia electrophaga TaxID=1748243 RepID=A0A0S2TD73_9GAMM|nr:hypothetical protein Tel_07975 [Candidatus Tenderia electrophaga]
MSMMCYTSRLGYGLLLLLCAAAIQAGEEQPTRVAGLFDDFKEQLKQRLEEKSAATQETENDLAETEQVDLDVLALAAEAHDYEGALRPDDYTCATIVEPFTLEKNIAQLFGASDMTGLITLFKKPDKAVLLDSAKQKAKRMNWLPMGFERQYGSQLHEQKIASDPKFIARSGVGRAKRQYQMADALLQRVVASIHEDHPYEFHLYLLNSSQIQGYSAPGGYIYLSTAALESDYADMVMAHEIAHVLKRHQTRELQARLIDTVTTLDELKDLMDLNGVARERYGKLLLRLSGSYLNFSRQQELQADACSVRIAGSLSSADMRHRIVSYTGELEKADRSDKERLFSIHASYPDRYQRMEAVAASMEKESDNER